MKIQHLIVLLVAVAAITSAAMLVTFNLSQRAIVKNAQSLPYVFYVNSTIGVDVGTDMLRLGAITPGSQAYRGVFIKDTLAEAAVSNQTVRQVRFAAQGQGSEWITFKPEVLSLPGEVKVTVSVPVGTKYGVYRGSILVIPLSNG